MGSKGVQMKVGSLAGKIRKSTKQNRDCVVVISGETGVGKSTLGYQLLKKYLRLKPDVNIEHIFEKHFVYTRASLVEKIKTFKKGSIIVIDEAINALFRRDFMKGKQKELIKLLNMCRDRNLVLIFNIPNFWDLDTTIRDFRIRLWIYVDERGMAYVFAPDRNPFVKDPWHTKENEKKLRKWRDGIHPKISPNYVVDLTFDNFSPGHELIYEMVRDRKKKSAEVDEEEEEKKSIITKRVKSNIIWTYIMGLLRELPRETINQIITVAARKENIHPDAIKKRIERLKFKDRQGQSMPNNYLNRKEEQNQGQIDDNQHNIHKVKGRVE